MADSTPSFYDEWLNDQIIAFSATWLITDSSAMGSLLLCDAAVDIIVSTVHDLEHLSVATLCLLASIPESIITDPEAKPLSEIVDTAKRLKNHIIQDSRSFRLYRYAAALLQRQGFTFEDFLQWARRIGLYASNGDDSPRGWSKDTWQHLSRLDADEVCGVQQHLDVIQDVDVTLAAKIDSLNSFYDLAKSSLRFSRKRLDVVPLIRITKEIMSRQFCWPLMFSENRIAGDDGRTKVLRTGFSLPIFVQLNPDGRSKCWFSHQDGKRKIFKDATSSKTMFGFNNGCLRWDKDWSESFAIGLATAKKLWSSQNGRLQDLEEKNRKESLSLEVDMTHADKIVSTLLSKDKKNSHTYPLTGRSAEIYWSQVALALMLPERSLPEGVASGRIVAGDGFFRTWINCDTVGPKLRYAADSLRYSRVVLPESCAFTNEETDEGVGFQSESDDADEIPEIDKVEKLGIEINYCPSARSAADALQSSGWRRAFFFRAPQVQRSFYGFLYQLFARQNGHSHDTENLFMADDLLSARDRKFDKALGVDAVFLNPLPRLTDYLLSTLAKIKFCECSYIVDDDMFGRWLAWNDHEARKDGPGLGIICLRTADGDIDMRVWAALFELLKAHPGIWEEFQWAGLEQSAMVLASLLNNFRGDSSTACSPAPDLLIIIDDAGLTQRAGDRSFPNDYRGHFFELLNPKKAKTNYFLEKQLAPHIGLRKDLFGNTRILIVYSENS